MQNLMLPGILGVGLKHTGFIFTVSDALSWQMPVRMLSDVVRVPSP
jgi:hypothetical protein